VSPRHGQRQSVVLASDGQAVLNADDSDNVDPFMEHIAQVLVQCTPFRSITLANFMKIIMKITANFMKITFFHHNTPAAFPNTTPLTHIQHGYTCTMTTITRLKIRLVFATFAI